MLNTLRFRSAGGEDWEEIVLVDYPTLQAFIEMTGDPDHPSDICAGSLADARLSCRQLRPTS